MRKIRSWEYRRLAGESGAEYLVRMLVLDTQLLAADANLLIRHYYPPGTTAETPLAEIAADDLAEDFNTRLEQAEWNVDAKRLISADALAKIHAVDKKLGEMSGPQDPELWTDAGLRSRAEWNEVRHLAKAALEAMDYELDSPPPWSGPVISYRS